MTKKEFDLVVQKLTDEYFFNEYILFLPTNAKKELFNFLKNVDISDLHLHSQKVFLFLSENLKAAHYMAFDYKKDEQTLNLIKRYKHSINLTPIKSELFYHYGSYAKVLFMQWSNKDGLTMDQVAEELKDFNIGINAYHPADQFIEMLNLYNNLNKADQIPSTSISRIMNYNDVEDYKNYVVEEINNISNQNKSQEMKK